MNRYVIQRSRVGPPPLVGEAQTAPWALADVAAIDHFPWYAGGERQPTALRALYDDEAVYLQFLCSDRHIFSHVTEINGPVHQDSCVEFFAAPAPADGSAYFNFEVNCCGVIHLGYGRSRKHRRLAEPRLARRIRVASSIATATREESPDDDGWWLAAAIPFAVLGELSGGPVAPPAGSVWRGNFYRCGGQTDGQFACWSPIRTARPDFHRPEFFGELRFQ